MSQGVDISTYIVLSTDCLFPQKRQKKKKTDKLTDELIGAFRRTNTVFLGLAMNFICSSIRPFVSPSFSQFVCLSIRQLVCPSVRLLVNLLVFLPNAHKSVSSSVRNSVSLFFHALED